MKTFRLTKDFVRMDAVYHTYKKGTIFFEKRQKLGTKTYSNYVDEYGFYDCFGDTATALRKVLVQIKSKPYSPNYYLNQHTIKKLRAENKKEEERFKKKNNYL